jgi:hypothetical protein
MRATNLSTEKRSASSRVGRVTAKATVDRDQCTTSPTDRTTVELPGKTRAIPRYCLM